MSHQQTEKRSETIKLFGIETEYGITREDLETVDPVVESMELVRAHLAHEFHEEWDYQGEDPHQDARGFRVASLSQDKEEEEFVQRVDSKRPFSFREMKSDLVLVNGARFYNDHTHPEYSTPECRRLKDLVIHDRAGEWILRQAAQRRNQLLGGDKVQLYKNNTDFHGHSYGCHDNYLLPRAIPFGVLADHLIPFLVTRQIIAGAGKMGIESQKGFEAGHYQISQRADFIETGLSIDTMHNRPILNTRDEPHADPTQFRRLHLILGDANMSEYATALKIGTTLLVLELIKRGEAPRLTLEQPVAAIRRVSQDPDLKNVICLQGGTSISALDLQGYYLESAKKHLAGEDPESDWILAEWEEVLTLLANDREKLKDRLDWITKAWLLRTFCEEEKLSESDPWLVSLDLEYHNLSPERGLFLGLEAEGKIRRLTMDREIEEALHTPPSDSRAAIRGLCVRRFQDRIHSIQWERITFKDGWRRPVLEMDRLFDPKEIAELHRHLETAPSLDDALKTLPAIRSNS